MNMQDYSKQAVTFDVYDDDRSVGSHAFLTKVLGLGGETGEVTNKVKKIIRDKGGIITDEEKKELVKELGDVLWYTTLIAGYLGYNLEDVAQLNIDKLSSRKARNQIKGSGDNR